MMEFVGQQQQTQKCRQRRFASGFVSSRLCSQIKDELVDKTAQLARSDGWSADGEGYADDTGTGGADWRWRMMESGWMNWSGNWIGFFPIPQARQQQQIDDAQWREVRVCCVWPGGNGDEEREEEGKTRTKNMKGKQNPRSLFQTGLPSVNL